jgi:hypothetical protein
MPFANTEGRVSSKRCGGPIPDGLCPWHLRSSNPQPRAWPKRDVKNEDCSHYVDENKGEENPILATSRNLHEDKEVIAIFHNLHETKGDNSRKMVYRLAKLALRLAMADLGFKHLHNRHSAARQRLSAFAPPARLQNEAVNYLKTGHVTA